MNYLFPNGFKWGGSVWATGTEGASESDGKAPTVWDELYRINPSRFYNCIGPNDTLNFYEDYNRFVSLASDLKYNCFRTSILWARLLPNGKNINDKALNFYKSMFQSIKDKGMNLSVVLYWFDMPLMYESKGGFTNREIIDDFVFYCDTCFKLFDGLVDDWFVYNEPIMDIRFKYQLKVCYPNLVDMSLSLKATYNMVVAHAKVVKVFKDNKYKGRIGTVLNRCCVYPRSDDFEDLKAKKDCETLLYDSFEYPLLKGEINNNWLEFVHKYTLLDTQENDLKLIKENTIDFIGINYYFPQRVKKKENIDNTKPITFESFWDNYVYPLRRFNADRGWEILPEGLYDTLMHFKNEFSNPSMYITENGIGIQNEDRYRGSDGLINDDYRVSFISEHLKHALRAIQDGAKLEGYLVWSFIDLWSPTNQFKNCYGLYEYNTKTKEVKRKQSANFFQRICEDNGLEDCNDI